MGQKAEDRPQLRPQVPATPADGVESAQTLLTLGFAENAGTQIFCQLSGRATDVLRIVREAMSRTLSCQVNAVSLKSDNEGLDGGALEDHDHLSLAACLFTKNRPPGLP